MAWIEREGGLAVPAPDWGSNEVTISTLVDGGRNQNGSFIGQVIGEDKYSVQLKFGQLTNGEIQRFLALFDRRQGGAFTGRFRVFDPRVNGFRWLEMYVGDRKGTPYLVNSRTDRPAFWRNVTAALIEV